MLGLWQVVGLCVTWCLSESRPWRRALVADPDFLDPPAAGRAPANATLPRTLPGADAFRAPDWRPQQPHPWTAACGPHRQLPRDALAGLDRDPR